MGASFRNTDQCKQLAGLDMLTISPGILQALQDEKMAHIDDIVPDGQSSNGTSSMEDVDVSSEGAFRWAYNDDACTVEKTAEALRRFASDTRQLEIMLAAR